MENPRLLAALFSVFKQADSVIGFGLKEEGSAYSKLKDNRNETWWRVVFSPELYQLCVLKGNKEVTKEVVSAFITHKTVDQTDKNGKAPHSKPIYETKIYPALTGGFSQKILASEQNHLSNIIQVGIRSQYSEWKDPHKPLPKEQLNPNTDGLQIEIEDAVEELRRAFEDKPAAVLNEHYPWFLAAARQNPFLQILAAAVVLGLNVSIDFDSADNPLNQQLIAYLERPAVPKSTAQPKEERTSLEILKRATANIDAALGELIGAADAGEVETARWSVFQSIEAFGNALGDAIYFEAQSAKPDELLDFYKRSILHSVYESRREAASIGDPLADLKQQILEYESELHLEIEFLRLMLYMKEMALKEAEGRLEKETRLIKQLNRKLQGYELLADRREDKITEEMEQQLSREAVKGGLY